MADTHTVMPKKLAQALMEAGMQHFDIGGAVGGQPGMVNQQKSGGIGGAISGVLGSNNDFQAAGADNLGQIGQLSGQYQDVYGQQQALASQLLAQTQGGGPGNALVAQQGANLNAQQAATQAGVRGASANPGLVARNAQMAGQQGQNQVLNAQTAMQLQSQGALAQQQSGMANQSLQGQSIAQGAIAAQNNVNAGVAGQNAATNGGILGGVLGAVGSLFNRGGEVKKMAAGGPVNDNMGIAQFGGQGVPQYGGGGGGKNPMTDALSGVLGKGLKGMFSSTPMDPNGNDGYNQYAASGFDPAQMSLESSRQDMAQMGGIPMPDPSVAANMPSPSLGGPQPVAGGPGVYAPVVGDPFAGVGPNYQVGQQNPDFLNRAQGGNIPFRQMLAGGNVPGHATVKGDSEKNDTVPTMLSPGEVVLPRSVTEGPNAPQKAAEFLKHLKSKKKGGYDEVAKARGAKRGVS